MKRLAREQDLVKGKTGLWEIVIGLEVHARIKAEAKLFSSASTEFGAPPNAQVSLVDAALPGMLPVINGACVEQAVKASLGIGATVHKVSIFERKNYFYPDLPQGYQISQYQQPLATGGEIILDLPEDRSETIGIERLHMEQDAGKSLHEFPGESLIDLNRSGSGLMEIVSHPSMRSAEEAQAYIRKLRAILRYLDVCDGNMEEGSLRADVNISLRRPGKELGERAEIKNVNSIRFAGQAIAYEVKRQMELLEAGEKVVQETRLFDPASGKTRRMRTKEDAHDYRYFPDPDLPPLILTEAEIEKLRAALPELPDAKKTRLMQEYGLPAYDASVLAATRQHAEFFETATKNRDPIMTAHWITGDLFGALNKHSLNISQSPISPENLGELIDLIKQDTISGRTAKTVFETMVETGKNAKTIVDEEGLGQISDENAIREAASNIIARNPEKAEQVKEKPNMLGWFVGQIMQETGGKANPKLANKILREKLGLN